MYAVFGAGGFLGRHLCARLKSRGEEHLSFSSRGDGSFRIDLNQHTKLPELPEWGSVSHAFILSGITALDTCFREHERTHRFNVENTCVLALQLMSRGIVPIFVSSDLVFDGGRAPFRECDPRAPNTAYGRQKAEVEQILESSQGKHLIVRFSKLYSLEEDDQSSVAQVWRTLKAGDIVSAATDQAISPTYVGDAVTALLRLADEGQDGIWHFAAPERLTRYTMAKLMAEHLAISDSLIQPIRIADLPLAETRPLDNTLDCSKYVTKNPSTFLSLKEAMLLQARLSH